MSAINESKFYPNVRFSRCRRVYPGTRCPINYDGLLPVATSHTFLVARDAFVLQDLDRHAPVVCLTF